MNTFVTTFILEEGINDELTGPFVDREAALRWIDEEIVSLKEQYSNFQVERTADSEFTMFCDVDAEDPQGYVYQVIEASIPVEVVSGD